MGLGTVNTVCCTGPCCAKQLCARVWWTKNKVMWTRTLTYPYPTPSLKILTLLYIKPFHSVWTSFNLTASYRGTSVNWPLPAIRVDLTQLSQLPAFGSSPPYISRCSIGYSENSYGWRTAGGILFAVLNSHDCEYQDQGLVEYEVSTLLERCHCWHGTYCLLRGDRECRFLRNVCMHVPDYTASHSRQS